jgi:hypothetical protein
MSKLGKIVTNKFHKLSHRTPEARSSPWENIASGTLGEDECSGGAWIIEFNTSGSYTYANYVTEEGVGRELTCSNGHNYFIDSAHYLQTPSNYFVVSREDP